MTRLLAMLALLVSSHTAWGAQPPSPLGRLFFTPQERAKLDHARRYRLAAEQQAAGAKTATKPKQQPPRRVVVNGYVKRSDGESTVWLNSQPVRGKTEEGLQVRPATEGTVVLRAPQARHSVAVKVGQQVDLTTGRIDELYRLQQPKPEAEAPPANAAATQPPKLGQRRHRSSRQGDGATAEKAGPPPVAGEGATEGGTE